MNGFLLNKESKALKEQLRLFASQAEIAFTPSTNKNNNNAKKKNFEKIKKKPSIKLKNLTFEPIEWKTPKHPLPTNKLSSSTIPENTNNKSILVEDKFLLKTEKEIIVRERIKKNLEKLKNYTNGTDPPAKHARAIRKSTKKLERNNLTYFEFMPFNSVQARSFSTSGKNRDQDSVKEESLEKIIKKIDHLKLSDYTPNESIKDEFPIQTEQKSTSSKKDETSKIKTNNLEKKEKKKPKKKPKDSETKKNFKILKKILNLDEFIEVAREYSVKKQDKELEEYILKKTNSWIKPLEEPKERKRNILIDKISSSKTNPELADIISSREKENKGRTKTNKNNSIDFKKTSKVLDENTKPINEKNMGHKLLTKMGWKQGTGLGVLNQGIIDPIKPVIRRKNKGLGN